MLELQIVERRLASIESCLANLTSLTSLLAAKASAPKEDTIGIDEVAAILQLSKDTIYTKTHKKTIPHRKEGKKLLFSRKEIEDYLSDRKVKTVKEEFAEAEGFVSKQMRRRVN
jgi:excisionase family DNA binding protein